MTERTAYNKAMALRLVEKQREQRAMSPAKIGQRLLREFCGAQGFGAFLDPMTAAYLVRLVEAVVIAERVKP